MSDLTIGGRKYSVTLFSMKLGAALALIGVAAAVARPTVAQFVADIVGTFGLIVAVSNGSYNAADGAVAWKHGPKSRSSVVQETKTTVTGPAPADGVT